MPAENYASFLVRLWRHGGGSAGPYLRGELESVQSGQAWEFQDLPALFQLFQTQVDSHAWHDEMPGDEE